MIFESRGIDKIMTEITRVEHLKIVIRNSINNFIFMHLYSEDIEVTNYAIDKFNILEDSMEMYKYIIRDEVVKTLMIYQKNLIDMITGKTHLEIFMKPYDYLLYENRGLWEAYKTFYMEKSIEERMNELKGLLVNDDKLFEAFKYLDRSFYDHYIDLVSESRLNTFEFGLDSIFKKEVIKKIEDEIEEHIIDIYDVQSGRVIRTINQKLIERERKIKEKIKREYCKKLEGEKEYEKYDEIGHINASYWSDYEDSIREVRGLDKECPVF